MSNRARKQQPSLRQTTAMRAQEAARAAERLRTRRQRIYLGLGGAIGAILLVVAIVAFAVTRPSDSKPVPSPFVQRLGCASCHSIDGSRSEGPTWDGLWGSTVELQDGTTVEADEAYIRQSIAQPHDQVVAGFTDTMPVVSLTAAEEDRLVAYIRSLGED